MPWKRARKQPRPTPRSVAALAQGALFCGDFLIDVSSLSDRTKSTLSLPRYLLTSTNDDSRLFGREMNALRELMRETQQRLARTGATARAFPGHGDFYAVEEAQWFAE